MDDEKDEQPPFRWNPQAVFMLFFFMLAMAIPLMGVAWFARGYLSAQQRAVTLPAPAPTPAARIDMKTLEKSLERVSDEQFASTVTLKVGNGVELEVAAEDMNARIARIMELARDAGGSALDMSSSKSDGAARRVMVQVPASRYELLKRAIHGDRVDFSAIPAGTAAQMFEVDLKAP